MSAMSELDARMSSLGIHSGYTGSGTVWVGGVAYRPAEAREIARVISNVADDAEGEDEYTVTWSYETAAQGMSPREAAELALSVIRSGMDPAATRPGYVGFAVSLNGAGAEDVEVPLA